MVRIIKDLGLARARAFFALFGVIILTVSLVAVASGGNGNEQIGELFSYISPRPDAEWVSPGTTIAFRTVKGSGADIINDISVNVTGSSSGVHEGQVILAGDEKTIIFKPKQLFRPQEMVSVAIESDKAFSQEGGPVSIQQNCWPKCPGMDLKPSMISTRLATGYIHLRCKLGTLYQIT